MVMAVLASAAGVAVAGELVMVGASVTVGVLVLAGALMVAGDTLIMVEFIAPPITEGIITHITIMVMETTSPTIEEEETQIR